jgi:hypothetical protein
MTILPLRFTGKFLYFVGALILIPVGAVFVASPNTLMLAGPIVLLVPIAGGIFALIGKWMTRKALFLEKNMEDRSTMRMRK